MGGGAGEEVVEVMEVGRAGRDQLGGERLRNAGWSW